MALPTVADCKAYLRIEHTVEDTMLTGMLAQSIAAIEAYLARPITILTRTWIVEQHQSGASATKLFVPLFPIAVADSSAGTDDLTLTDGENVILIEDTDYRLDTRTGVITAVGSCFGTWPYTIVADVGLEALDEYTTHVEPALSAAVLDVVADRYQRRNPAATSEDAADPGASFTTSNPGLPARVCEALAPWRLWPVV
jgi:uncharacterized phiE125 gp8 family phage protein